MIIKAVLDVTKIEKLLLKSKTWKKRDGSQGKSINLDLVLIPCKKGNSHYLVKQGCTKKEEEAFPDLPIIGSANEKGVGARPPMDEQQPDSSGGSEEPEEDLPF